MFAAASSPGAFASRALRVIERLFLILAVLSLAWYAAVQTMTSFAQASWTSELEGMAGHQPAVLVPDSLVGRIELPRVGVSAIAREGVGAGTLRRAVGHVPRTALPGARGNAAFAGHRDTFFRGLRDVRPGDVVTVTTPSGMFRYIVREARIVLPSDVSVLDPTSQPTLTLVTCYPFTYLGPAPKRFVVRATMAEVASAHRP
jgi:sortase A